MNKISEEYFDDEETAEEKLDDLEDVDSEIDGNEVE